MKGCVFGSHRVIEPVGSLPQAAMRIDNSPDIMDNEILIDVRTLNVDSASFTQIREACRDDVDEIAKMIKSIVESRGKLQNPVTGSGGMLIGTISQIGKSLADRNLKLGDRIATLVSLSLTPLLIEKIENVYIDRDQVDIKGSAVLFESGIYAKLPDDLPERLSLAVLDVAGAPAQVDRLVSEGMTVAVMGAGGKSGVLCCYEAKKKAGPSGRVIAVEYSRENTRRLLEMGLADEIIMGDATKPLEIYDRVKSVTDDGLCDVVINNVNVPGTEMSSILSTRTGGTVYFFSMATSFTKAALGAEGVGKDIDMIIGNGYAEGHADLALNILRESSKIRELFEKLYV